MLFAVQKTWPLNSIIYSAWNKYKISHETCNIYNETYNIYQEIYNIYNEIYNISSRNMQHFIHKNKISWYMQHFSWNKHFSRNTQHFSWNMQQVFRKLQHLPWAMKCNIHSEICQNYSGICSVFCEKYNIHDKAGMSHKTCNISSELHNICLWNMQHLSWNTSLINKHTIIQKMH